MKIFAALLFLISVSYAYAQAPQLGCCTNPGAGILSCSSDKLASLNQECCPQPESSFTSYYKSAQNQDSPANYAECSSKFFYPAQSCSAIAACAVGCCCSELGGSVKPESQCKGTGLLFHKGQIDCSQLCAAPQCNDGIDNDKNGCVDFSGRDSGCTSAADATESGGTCLSQGLDCNNPLYEPKLTKFEVTAAKGQKKFLLSWEDECKSNSLYYEVYRCEGVGCTNFEIISTLNKNSFEDASEALQFGKIYTFKVKAYYSLQSAAPFAVRAGSLGNLECINRLTSNIFCLNNEAYYCNALNNLVQQGTKCSTSEICIVTNNKPSCFPKSKCEEKKGNPLGLYYTKDGCEKDKWTATDAGTYKYCFYDRSSTIVDYCFNCNPSMSCYDYKAEQACRSDNCKIGNGDCEWKQLSTELGIGACVKKNAYNCEWCEKKGTESLENLRAYNEIFDRCTKEKSDALSTESFKCYFNNGKSTSCESTSCTNYAPEQCSSTEIKHDRSNNLINPSNDQCRLKVCQNINNVCVKNADGDGKADCSTKECEADHYAPRTIAAAINKKGVVDSIALQIYDKTSFDNSYVLAIGQDYKTYLCLEPCNFEGHPYDISTQSRHLLVSNLNVFDGNDGKKLLSLKEGTNSINYYSQDTSKNIEIVQTLSLEAHENSIGPKVFRFNVTYGNKVNEKLYTNSAQPTILVKFLEPSIVTYARLINKNTNLAVNLELNDLMELEKHMPLSQILPDGEYRFELNAKSRNNIFMDNVFIATVVIDTVKPEISFSPAKDEVIETPSATLSLTFSEEASLEKAAVNSEEITSKFSTVNNKIFTATVELADGNKILEAIAGDFANNKARASSSFIVDSSPLKISMTMPKYNVSPVYAFDIIIETDNEAECRYELDNSLEFEFMSRFGSTTGTSHTIRNFNKIPQNDITTHKLYVRCNDKKYGPQLKVFDLSVDTTPPEIKNAFAYPNPIIERPMATTLTVETDEPALCKYSKSQSIVCPQDVQQCPDGSFVSRDPNNNCNFRTCAASREFVSMKEKFSGFDNAEFRTINRKEENIENEGDYSYAVMCENKAGLSSNIGFINFKADLSKQILITSHTPQFFDSATAMLAIETSKKAQCKYSETDSTAQTGTLFGASGYSHTKELVLPIGEHTFYIVCKDQYLEQWSSVFTVKFAIDTTGPSMLYVDDNSTVNLPLDRTCNTDRLRVNYLGQDLESGVREYFYTILKGSQPIANAINSFRSGEWIWVEGLSLEDNTQYFFSVNAENYVGLKGGSKLSDGITVDTSYCRPAANCGDSLINQPGEECDTNTFGAIGSCLNFTNFIGGTLKCTSCKLDTSECVRIPDCGNGQLEPGESCDGNIFGAINSCTKFDASFDGGALKCTTTCQLDTTSCIEKPKCGNSYIDIGESCDGSNFGPLSGTCTGYNPSTFTGGNLACSSCRIDTSGCQGAQGNCGDGIINIGEACDITNLGQIKDCADYSASFSGGTLTCSAACQINTTSCIEKPKCGNSYIDIGESCDTNNLVPLSGRCVDYSSDFNDGSLKCTDCKLDTNDCGKTPACGNNKLDTGESCDGNNFGNITDKSCASYKDTFNSGTLTCKDCRISTDNCDSNATVVPPIRCRDRGECKLNEPCSDNSDCESRFCNEGKCTSATCSDSVKNQDESDTDCGGPCSAKCNDGSFCTFNSDCRSGFCSLGKCGNIEACSDGKLGGGEADTDCGGPCPAKCIEGSACILNDDCTGGLECVSSQCKKIEAQTLDSDGDGLPDEWEVQNGLDPNDPTDANQDPDNDGLTSKEEYEMVNLYGSSTNPNNADTDNDGYSDKEEIEKNTDPTNPEDFPKSNFTKIILFIAGMLILLGGFGYLAYIAVQKRREQEFASKRMPRQATPMQRQTTRQQYAPKPSMPISAQRARTYPNLRAAEEQKALERKRLFEPFGAEKTKEKPGKLEAKTTKPEAPKEKSKEISKHKKIATKKPKEDVFLRLKSMAQEAKKKPGKKNVPK